MYSVTSQSGNTTAYVMSFVIDSPDGLGELPISPDCAVGSDCLCLSDSSVYILSNENVWTKL